jgi:hypothetical protein
MFLDALGGKECFHSSLKDIIVKPATTLNIKDGALLSGRTSQATL